MSRSKKGRRSAARRGRRSLSQLGGRVRRTGGARISAVFADAWERAEREDPNILTHGFHSWPARMHWALARAAIETFRARTVLDPFCGGGTVLVEALCAGRRSIGLDLNPLAERVARVRARVTNEAEREAFVESARRVAEASTARVRARVPVQVDLPRAELDWYDPHVIKELGGLLEEIRTVEDDADRLALVMVFSSNLVKVSRQLSDTRQEAAPRRIRKGLTTELFLRKSEELARRWAELAERASGARPMLYEAGVQRLARIANDRRVDLIVTSPPYGGTYDYADHHRRRIAWLGLDDSKLRRFELGARRRLSHQDGAERWEEEVDEMLAAMGSVVRAGGHLVLVLGDARVGGRPVSALEQIERIGRRHRLELIAAASQARGGRTRRREEHVIVVQRS